MLCVCCAQLYLTVTQQTVTHKTALSMEFSRQEYWSGFSFSPPRGLLYSGIKCTSLPSPALVGRFFITAPTGKPNLMFSFFQL